MFASIDMLHISISLNLSIFREVTVLKSEVALFALTPRAFPVEVDVYALFVFFRDGLGFGVPLEPS